MSDELKDASNKETDEATGLIFSSFLKIIDITDPDDVETLLQVRTDE